MANEQLINYVSQARQSGKTDEQIRQELLNDGWQINDVNEVLTPTLTATSGKSLKLPMLILAALLITAGGYFASAYYLTLWPFETKSDVAIVSKSGSESAPTIKKYNPNDLGFIITVPTDWKYQSIDSNEPDLVASFKYESPDSQKSFLITIIGNIDPEKTTLNAWAKSDALKQDTQAKEDLASKIGNYLWTSYTGEVSGKMYKKLYLIRGIPKHIYRVSVEMDKSSSWMQEFDQIASTFQFFEPKTDNFVTYKNIQFAFELTYPDTWRAREESEGVRLRNYYNPILDKPIKAKDFSVLYQKDKNPEKLSAENWLLKNTFWTTYSKSKEYIKIGGQNAVKLYYEKPSPLRKDEIVKSYGYIIFRDKDVIHSSYSSKDGSPDATIDKIIQSIKFPSFNAEEYSAILSEEQSKIIGEDKDNDGVWDYIEEYIKQKYPQSEKVRAALYQYSKAMQSFLLDNRDEQKSLANTDKMSKANDCLIYIYGGDFKKAYDTTTDLHAKILNTKERSEAYIRADAQLGGHSFALNPESEYKSYCDFDPDKLAN